LIKNHHGEGKTMAARTSRAARGAAQAQQGSTVVPITGGGRAATGDNGGGRTSKPESTTMTAPSTPPKTAKPKLTPSTDRLKRGTSDAEIVAGVRAYCREHFNDGGWDVISEAWSDEQIVEAIGWAETVPGALKKMRGVVSVYADQQADAKNSE
jgi:hypothetical protein